MNKYILKFLSELKLDPQFDKSHEDYLGFINIDPEVYTGEYKNEILKIVSDPNKYKRELEYYGLYIESAHDTELIICAYTKR